MKYLMPSTKRAKTLCKAMMTGLMLTSMLRLTGCATTRQDVISSDRQVETVHKGVPFTPREDGKIRTSVTITYRIGREELICFLCKRIAGQGEFWYPGQAGVLCVDAENRYRGRGPLIEAFKDEVEGSGIESLGYWSDGTGQTLANVIREHAGKEIDRLFPELKETAAK